MPYAMRMVTLHPAFRSLLRTNNFFRVMRCTSRDTPRPRSSNYRYYSTEPKDHSADDDASTANRNVARVKSALSAGPLPYERGWAWQHVLLNRQLGHMRRMQRLVEQQQNDDGTSSNNRSDESVTLIDSDANCNDTDWLLLFEHKPVYTLGRGASEDHLTFLDNEPDKEKAQEQRRRLGRKYRGEDASRLTIDRQSERKMSQTMTVEEEVDHISNQSVSGATSFPPVYAPNGSPIYRIERGGEVTYHGPGQLVMYPLLDLRRPAYERDLHWYLRQIEEVIIRTLSEFDIRSDRDAINTGVWAGRNKIAAVGVSSSRWITTHGLAINVHPNLDHFDKDIITPCGIEERGVTSIAELLGSEDGGDNNCPTVKEVGDVCLKCFGDVFGVELVDHDPIR
mmetsp:Transcript_22849/g.55085  ORF Transcript_22849/g.55085 Transcript_22849/m.55085 type:complete len:395 (+) Transcript_22849:193-1377(+)